MDNLESSLSVNSDIDKLFIVSFFENDLCSLLHDWHKKIEVGKETHSIELLPHSRHLLFPGIDKRL